MSAETNVSMWPLRGLPLVKPGDDLAALLGDAIAAGGESPADRDVLVIAQKVVSKAEGRLFDLRMVQPSPRAIEVARQTEKDPRLVELILGESRRIVRHRPNVLVVENRNGFVMANAGADRSNVAAEGEELVLLLPVDADASAAALHKALSQRFGVHVAVVINDSFGRPFRRGTQGVAIGAAGLPAIVDKRGTRDLFGYELQHTLIGFADEIAAAASLIMGQAAEGRPAVMIRGLSWDAPEAPVAELIRDPSEDLFR